MRRRFLRISTGAAGLAAVGGIPAAGLRDWLGPAKAGDEIRTIPTYCDICFWKCGALAYTRNGKLWKIEGNPRGEPWDEAADLGSVVGDLDPSAEIYRPRLRYRLVDESAYDRQFLETLNSPVADRAARRGKPVHCFGSSA